MAVTTPAPFGTVEHFAERLRQYTDLRDFNSVLVGTIEGLVGGPVDAALARIRAALAAAELIRAERTDPDGGLAARFLERQRQQRAAAAGGDR